MLWDKKCTLSLETLLLIVCCSSGVGPHLFVHHRHQRKVPRETEGGSFGDLKRAGVLILIWYKLCLIGRLCCASDRGFDCKSARFIKQHIRRALPDCRLNVSLYESFLSLSGEEHCTGVGEASHLCSSPHENPPLSPHSFDSLSSSIQLLELV